MRVPVNIRISEFTGGPFAVSAEDGQRIYDRIVPLLRGGTPVSLSFSGIETIVGTFLTSIFGPLYNEFDGNCIDDLLAVQAMSYDDCAMVERIIANAKRYRTNPAAFDQAWLDVIGNNDFLEEVMHYEAVKN